jgi:hypothetical protein
LDLDPALALSHNGTQIILDTKGSECGSCWELQKCGSPISKIRISIPQHFLVRIFAIVCLRADLQLQSNISKNAAEEFVDCWKNFNRRCADMSCAEKLRNCDCRHKKGERVHFRRIPMCFHHHLVEAYKIYPHWLQPLYLYPIAVHRYICKVHKRRLA